MILIRVTLFMSGLIPALCSFCQNTTLPQGQSASEKFHPVSPKYLSCISSRAVNLEGKLDKRSEKALSRFQKQEAKIRRKLAKKDSLKAVAIFGSAQEQYEQLQDRLQDTVNTRQYIPTLDTLGSSLKFLQQNPQFLQQTGNTQQHLNEALKKVNDLQSQFKRSEEVKKFLQERKQYLKDQLNRSGLTKGLKKINKEVYYYSSQLKEYKELLKDHNRAERKAIEMLSKTKLFKDFMRKNSQLASLFRLPGSSDDPVSIASLAGLQTRAQVNSVIQQQIGLSGAGAQQQFQQNLQSAQSQLNELKNKVSQFKGSSSDDIMPEGFKPNGQRIKSFWRRLEYGVNIQTQKANGYWPVTSDLGVSVGYKLNDKSVIGLGGSYKLGWGNGWRKLRITSEGASLRSFVDWNFKRSYWITGGFEMNYRAGFNSIDQLKYLNAWQQSGLIGLSKAVSAKNKFFKKVKLQLLWDFLSYQQVPKASPIVFRINYTR